MPRVEHAVASQGIVGLVRWVRGTPSKDEGWAVLEDACKNMGVDLAVEAARIEGEADAGWRVVDALIVGDNGDPARVKIIDMRTYKSWLATVDTEAIKSPTIRGKIRHFQRQVRMVIERELGPIPNELKNMRWGY